MAVVFVIPVFNEEPTIEALATGITRYIGERPHRIIFVDDGSTDASWTRIMEMHARFPSVDAIRLRRNFGKTIALGVGFSLTGDGDIIFTMDADLQDDPKEIPRLLEKLEEGFDVVCGWKQRRHDPWHKTIPSRVYNGWIARSFGLSIHDVNTGFKVMRREVIASMPLYGDMHRLIPVFANSMGYRVTEIPVEHHPRKFGKSKYGIERIAKGAMDGVTALFLTRHGDAPGHFFGRMILFSGFLIFLVLFFAVAASMLVPLFYRNAPAGEQLAVTAIVLLMLLMSLVIVSVSTVGAGLGLVAELLLRRTPVPDPMRYVVEKHLRSLDS